MSVKGRLPRTKTNLLEMSKVKVLGHRGAGIRHKGWDQGEEGRLLSTQQALASPSTVHLDGNQHKMLVPAAGLHASKSLQYAQQLKERLFSRNRKKRLPQDCTSTKNIAGNDNLFRNSSLRKLRPATNGTHDNAYHI